MLNLQGRTEHQIFTLNYNKFYYFTHASICHLTIWSLELETAHYSIMFDKHDVAVRPNRLNRYKHLNNWHY